MVCAHQVIYQFSFTYAHNLDNAKKHRLPAHMSIAFTPPIHNIRHSLPCRLRFRSRDPLWVTPVLCRDQPKSHIGPGHGSNQFHELFRERYIVQNHIRVLKIPVEAVLNLPDSPSSALAICVSDQHHKRCVGATSGRFGRKWFLDEDGVISVPFGYCLLAVLLGWCSIHGCLLLGLPGSVYQVLLFLLD